MPYISIIASVVGSVASGALSSSGGSGGGGGGAGHIGKLPKVPDLTDAFNEGVRTQNASLDPTLELDQDLRDKWIPQQLQLGSWLYGDYLPQFAQSNLAALKRVDPRFIQGRNQLYNSVSGQLAQGNQIDPATDQQLVDEVRGAQAARGNLLGNAPAQEEALFQGQYGQQLLQQRQGAMEAFLNGASPEDKFGELGGVGSNALSNSISGATNPGFTFTQAPRDYGPEFANLAQTGFQDAESQALARAGIAMQGGSQPNPWLGALSGGLGAITKGAQNGSFSGLFGGGSGGSSSGGGSAGYGGVYGGSFGSQGGMGDLASPTFL